MRSIGLMRIRDGSTTRPNRCFSFSESVDVVDAAVVSVGLLVRVAVAIDSEDRAGPLRARIPRAGEGASRNRLNLGQGITKGNNQRVRTA